MLLLLLLLTFGASSCTSVPLTEEVAMRRLLVENPHEVTLALERVGGETTKLGSEPRYSLSLQAARYVVHGGGTSWPVPLLAELEEVWMTGCRVRVRPPPSPPEGFVHVPGGPTLIGDVLGVGAEDERPARLIEVAPFFAAVHETTCGQYAAFLNARGGCEEEWLDLGGPKCHVTENDDGSFESDAPRMPAVTVTLAGARAYCAWRTEETGVTHRLPTEEEWERLARGPASSTYAYGDVYRAAAANQESGRLVEVGRYPATGWGVHDLTGNAFEWTASSYDEGLQVLRGGSYVLDGPYLRNSFRMWYRPLVKADDIGFRVIREIEP